MAQLAERLRGPLAARRRRGGHGGAENADADETRATRSCARSWRAMPRARARRRSARAWQSRPRRRTAPTTIRSRWTSRPRPRRRRPPRHRRRLCRRPWARSSIARRAGSLDPLGAAQGRAADRRGALRGGWVRWPAHRQLEGARPHDPDRRERQVGAGHAAAVAGAVACVDGGEEGDGDGGACPPHRGRAGLTKVNCRVGGGGVAATRPWLPWSAARRGSVGSNCRAGIPTVTGHGDGKCVPHAPVPVAVVDRARLRLRARVSIRFALFELARWWGWSQNVPDRHALYTPLARRRGDRRA